MPLSELYRSTNGNNQSLQQKPPADVVSYIPNDEFLELIWEKGQIMMQGQSSKTKKTPVSSYFQFQPPKVQEKDGVLKTSEMGLNQDDVDDDDTVPWLDYHPFDDYNSNLLTELSGVTVHDPPMHNGLNVIENRVHKDPNSMTGLAHNASYKDPVQNQDSVLPRSTSTVLNFSHFSRPAAMAKAAVQNHGPPKETVQPGSASKPVDEPHCVEKCSNDVTGGNECKEGSETVKSNEPVGVCSSVCSGNSGERASNDLTKTCKRKFRDADDFECQSQDVEEESLGTKTAAASRGGSGSGSKRSRAAEVHNLSERRRRDRINEKMRALQELIPNCNKVDKASMLDEAIEYLKTLQLQVQIMSMGSGLCMPPMMFAPGMQHMHPHFSPMGMGMGIGYGMGMEMNGGQHIFPYSSPATQRSPPLYGHISQGMPMVLPQPPIPAVQQMATQLKVPDVGPGPIPDNNRHAMTQISTQAQVANKGLNQSTWVDKSD